MELDTKRPLAKRELVYDKWMRSIGVPVYEGHHVEDLKTVELAWWEERNAHAAFLHLKGMEGVSEARVMELAPGEHTPPIKLAVGELVYVLEGEGATCVWNEAEGERKTFEWYDKSLFHLPRHIHHQIYNTSGIDTVRLLHYNYLPVAMSAVPDPDFFFDNKYVSDLRMADNEEMFADASQATSDNIDISSVAVDPDPVATVG